MIRINSSERNTSSKCLYTNCITSEIQRQKLTELKGEVVKSIITVGKFNITVSVSDRINR